MREIEILKITRNNFIGLVKAMSLEQLNKIPDTHNNNIFWNFAHNVVTQQLLCYKLAGAEMRIPQDIVDLYRKGTGPLGDVSQADVDQMIEWAEKTSEWMEEDFNSGVLTANDYHEYTTCLLYTSDAADD